MQKWEYFHTTIQRLPRQSPDEFIALIIRTLDNLGDSGWEVCANPEPNAFLLKRPIEEEIKVMDSISPQDRKDIAIYKLAKDYQKKYPDKLWETCMRWAEEDYDNSLIVKDTRK